MEKRINIQEIQPAAYKAMYMLEKYLHTGALSKIHLHLIKIRASQINGCAFCIDMHTREALQIGETAQRIFLLSAWREAQLFTEAERVLLAITDEVTLIGDQGLTEETYKKALQFFDETYLAQILMAVVTINAWNRIAISTQLPIQEQN